MNIGFDGLNWVVFRRGHLFEGCGMDDIFNTVKSTAKPICITNIPKEIPKAGIFAFGELVAHFELFEFIAAENPDSARGIFRKQDFQGFLAKGA